MRSFTPGATADGRMQGVELREALVVGGGWRIALLFDLAVVSKLFTRYANVSFTRQLLGIVT